jgi:hypothetical protein
MKKSVAIITFVIFSIPCLHAQFLSVGPRVGISSSKVQVDERFTANGEEISYDTENAKVGFHVGAFARMKISSFYVQPELLYTSSGGSIAVESESKGKDIWNLRYNKIDLPVMAGFKFAKVLRIQAGPTFSYLLSTDARDTDEFDNISQNYKDATVGYQVGLGLDIGKLFLDFKYEGNLSNLGSEVSLGNQNFDTDFRNTQFILSAGLNLF